MKSLFARTVLAATITLPVVSVDFSNNISSGISMSAAEARTRCSTLIKMKKKLGRAELAKRFGSVYVGASKKRWHRYHCQYTGYKDNSARARQKAKALCDKKAAKPCKRL